MQSGFLLDKTGATLKTRPSAADESMSRSASLGFPDEAQPNAPRLDLAEEQNSSPKGRRSASCGSNCSPRFGQDIAAINAYSSFKSDQASIADWVDLLEGHEFQFDDGEPVEHLFRIINSDELEGRPTEPELPAMEDEDSKLAELNRAFIHEQSQMSLQGPSLLDAVDAENDPAAYSRANAASFSITEMLGRNEPLIGRKTQTVKRELMTQNSTNEEERKEI